MTPGVIIRKQKIKISTSNEQLALQLRKQFNDGLQYDLVNMMEKVFAQNTAPDIYVNINKLKIDLGTITVQNFEQHFIKLVESKLINELRTQFGKNDDSLYLAKEKHSFNNDTSTPSLQFNSIRQQELAALLHFLESGIYPWWYKKEIRQTPAQLLDNLTKDETETLILKILSIKKRSSEEEVKKIIKRFFIHLPETKNDSVIYQLLALYNSSSLTGNIKALANNKEEIIRLFSISSKDFYKQLFQFLIYENIENDENTIYNFFIQLKEDQNFSLVQLKERIAGYNTPLATELKHMLATSEETVKEKKIVPGKQSHTKAEEQGIYISNAGLVLLHPFLQPFFTEAELLNEQNQFTSIAARYKAAVLLYYLQCGNEQFNEWEMALNKIICGISSDEIIPDNILMSEKEKEECNFLLQTVVNYWEALKGASIEALQSTFILREGKITWKEEYWLIQVERTGVDILLERLPWGFSTIKLPWLESLIHTEW